MPDEEPPAIQSCPACGESILEAARKCRFCGAYLDAELAKAARQRRRGHAQSLAGYRVWAFPVLALLGGFVCQALHSCMCGHLAHSSGMRIPNILFDGVWVGLWALGIGRLLRLGGRVGIGARIGATLALLLNGLFVLMLALSAVFR